MANLCVRGPFAQEVETCLGKSGLALRNRRDDNVKAVIRVESPRADKVRMQRPPLPKRKLTQVHDIRHRLGLECELRENVDQIRGRNHQPVCFLQNWTRTAKSAQMVPRFTAVVVDQRLFPSQASEEQRRRWCNQERPVRRREDMSEVRLFKTSPEGQQVERLAHKGTQKRDALHPRETTRQSWVDGDQPSLDLRIVLPMTQEQIRLYGLPTYVAQRSGHYSHSQGSGLSGRPQPDKPERIRMPALLCEQFSVEIFMAFSHSFEREIRLCEALGVTTKFLAQGWVTQEALDRGGEVRFPIRRYQDSPVFGDQLGVPSHTARHDRHPGRHGLNDHIGKTLRRRR